MYGDPLYSPLQNGMILVALSMKGLALAVFVATKKSHQNWNALSLSFFERKSFTRKSLNCSNPVIWRLNLLPHRISRTL
jgi:hypothetical protein